MTYGALPYLSRLPPVLLQWIATVPSAIARYAYAEAFREGGPAYGKVDEPESMAGFDERSHIQIAVREKARIKGYFRPICD